MNSVEKIVAIKEAMLRTDDEFDGLLGTVQAFVAVDVMSGKDTIATEITSLGPERIDEELLGVVGFVLWLRSDDAPAIDLADVVDRMPGEVAELIAAAGIA